MDYTDLVKEIESQGITKLPALLIVVAEQCVKKKVFQPGGMERVISRIASNHEDKMKQKPHCWGKMTWVLKYSSDEIPMEIICNCEHGAKQCLELTRKLRAKNICMDKR